MSSSTKMLRISSGVPAKEGTDSIPATYSLNNLPCRINHNGPIPLHPRYWTPRAAATESPQPARSVADAKIETPPGVQESYFRGRKLLGQAVPLPEGFKASLLRKKDETVRDTSMKDAALRELEERRHTLSPEEYAEEMEEFRKDVIEGHLVEELGVVEVVGEIDGEMVVWGHDEVPESQMGWTRQLYEWSAMSAAIHDYDGAPGKD